MLAMHASLYNSELTRNLEHASKVIQHATKVITKHTSFNSAQEKAFNLQFSALEHHRAIVSSPAGPAMAGPVLDHTKFLI